ncbi:hypothetical protein C8T65DRAFT_698290 [Cerioporus squamosus]|nr:hypothetical protein C8T65DRAFT_698290 [Cerioporus squamosus]
MPKMMLNDDILLESFDYVCPARDRDATDNRNLAAAALVCHGWTRAAQVALYAGSILVKLDNVQYVDRRPDFDWQQASMSSLFVRTMRTCPHLRPLVRDITLQVATHVDKFTDKDIGWLRLLPPNGLRKFHCFWYTRWIPFQPSVLLAPAVLTARQVRLHSFRKVPVSSVMSLKGATSLQLEVVTSDVHLDRSHEIAFESCPPVSHLTLNMHDYPGHCQCLAALAPGLQSFTAVGAWFTYDYLARPVGETIARYASDVKELVLCADWIGQWRYAYNRADFRCAYPFLDDLATRKPKFLEHLVAPPRSCTEVFFQHLPPTLRILEFVLQDEKPFPFERFLRGALIRVRDESISMAMEKILFWSYVPCAAQDERYAWLRDVCAASGITFCHRALTGTRSTSLDVHGLPGEKTFSCCNRCCPEGGHTTV